MASSADKQNNTALLTSVKTIANVIKGIFVPSTPPLPVNKVIIRQGLPFREGLSKQDLWAAIQSAKKAQGIPTGPLPSGAQNVDGIVEKIRIDKTIDALLSKAKIEIVIPENALVVKVNGITSSGEAVQGVGINNIPIVGIAKGGGIIR